jgi:membrane-bound metal-dependent hydrolase YbcI (DUF457 family)
MADFNAHISAGLIVGYAGGAMAAINGWTTAHLTPFMIFAASGVGSFLPDLDCDSGKPLELVFGILSVLGGSLSFLYLLNSRNAPWPYWVAIPPIVALLIRYGVSHVFQKFTTHRGIFHSIPMLLIFVLLCAMALRRLQWTQADAFAISMGLGGGFLSHLLLDELCSVFDLSTFSFQPKRSLGTALCFTGLTVQTTLAAYALLVGLAWYNWSWVNRWLSALQGFCVHLGQWAWAFF